jgi:catechol 2,3-dioxygenase-like lactoylglutathione lyase family enzyme
MIIKFTNIRILVSDYAKSFAFYSGVLGLPVRFSDEQSGYGEFDTGTVTLALFSRENMAAALVVETPPSEGDGLGRAVLVLNVEDVDAACLELQKKGVAILVPPTDRPAWTIRTAHFKDPDGNLIEINSYLRS